MDRIIYIKFNLNFIIGSYKYLLYYINFKFNLNFIIVSYKYLLYYINLII